VCLAAELSCKARLREGEVRGEGQAEAARELLAVAPLGDRAAWDVTLGEAFLEGLKVLRKGGKLTLEVRTASSNSSAREELEELALLEWAHRLAAWLGSHLSLAYPAAQAQWKELPAPPVLSIHWRAGDLMPLRAVKKTIEQASTV
jgi:hypothetical protein